MLRLHLFDSPHIESTTTTVPALRSRKVEALLYYLALNPGSHRRIRLANLLWAESNEENALGNLRYALWNIRHELGEIALDADRSTITLHLNNEIWVDAKEFQMLLQTAIPSAAAYEQMDHASAMRKAAHTLHHLPIDNPVAMVDAISHLQQAADLYHGDLLAGFDLADAPDFEEWLQVQRTTFHHLATDALSSLGHYYTTHRQLPEALAATRQLLTLEPWQEAAHRQMMIVYAMMGRRDAALEQYEQCRELLATELGVEPEASTDTLMEQIRAGQLALDHEAPFPTPGESALAITAPTHTGSGQNPDLANFVKPLVGRWSEYNWLIQQWTESITNESGLVLIRGEAGIGKTRLVEEIGRYVLVQGGIHLQGRCYEFSGPLPYQPIVAALRAQIPQLKAQSSLVDAPWLADLAELLPELRQPNSESISYWSPPQHGIEKYQLFDAVSRCLQSISTQQPLLLFLDDLQWADTDTLDLIGYLVRRLAADPILIVGAYRPGEVVNDHALVTLRRPLYNEGLDQELILKPISTAAVQQVVQTVSQLKKGAPESELLTNFLFEISQGNPFIIFETLQEMQERGWLQPNAEGNSVLRLPATCLVGPELAYHANSHLLCAKDAPCHALVGAKVGTGAVDPSKTSSTPLLISAETLPDQSAVDVSFVSQESLIFTEVKNRIRRRIARLSPDSQHLLALVAVIGHPFEPKLIQAATDLSPTIAIDCIEDWLTRGLVREVSTHDESRRQEQPVSTAALLPKLGQYQYDFSHDLIRAVVYHDLSPLRQQSLHVQLGTALEQLYAGQIDKIVEWLAHHYHSGYEPTKALHYLQQAGRQAQAVYALPLAQAHYKQALFYWDQLHMPSSSHVSTEAWRQRWDLLLGLSEVDRMLGQLKQKQYLGWETVVQEVSYWGDERDQLRVIEEQLARLEHTPELEKRRQLAQEGLALARLLNDSPAEGKLLQASADCDRDMANHTEALATYEAALQIFSRTDQTRQVAACLNGMGQIHLCNHRFGQALSLFEQAVQYARTEGYQDALIDALNAIAQMYLFLGNFEGALTTSQTVLTLSERIGFDLGASTALATQGHIQMLQGDLESAQAQFDRAMRMQEKMGESLDMADIHCSLGHLSLLKEGYGDALAHFKQVEELCGNFYYGRAIEARSYRAMAHLAMDELKEALVCSHHAVVWLIGREHAMVAPQRVYWNQYQVLLARREPEEAQESLVKAHRVVSDQLENLAGAYPTTIDDAVINEQFIARLPWNQDILTMWDMLPITNSHVSLHLLHGYPG